MTLIHYIIDIILSKYDITQIHLYLNFLDPTSLWLASRAIPRLETPSAGSSGSMVPLFAETLSLYIRQPFGPRRGEITVIQFLV